MAQVAEETPSPLWLACEEGDSTKIAQILSEHKAVGDHAPEMSDIMEAFNQGETPLFVCCRNGHLENAKLLEAFGASVRQPDYDGATPLYIACAHGYLDVVTWLVEETRAYNDLLSPAYSNKESPYFAACATNQHSIVAYLEEGRSKKDDKREITRMNNMGRTPIYEACNNGHSEMAHHLMELGQQLMGPGYARHIVRSRDADGATLLHAAATNDNVELLDWLASLGAVDDIKSVDKRGFTPLFNACNYGRCLSVQWLLTHGAIETARKTDDRGWTPMFVACMYGHVEVAKVLCSVGASRDVRTKTKTGMTPMLGACVAGSLKAAQWLFATEDAAADISVVDCQGRTPMFVASQFGHLDVAQWLFRSGAAGDIRRCNSRGQTPIEAACQSKSFDVAFWHVVNGGASDIHGNMNAESVGTALGASNNGLFLLVSQAAAANRAAFPCRFLPKGTTQQNAPWYLVRCNEKALVRLILDFAGVLYDRKARRVFEARALFAM